VTFAVFPMVVALSALIQVCVPMSAVMAIRMPRNKAAQKKIGTHFDAEIEDSSSARASVAGADRSSSSEVTLSQPSSEARGKLAETAR
jgi:hypothetical protein